MEEILFLLANTPTFFLLSGPTTMEGLFEAARNGRVEEVEEILRTHPTLDVNRRNPRTGSSALHAACNWEHASVLAVLLAHPNIDVNFKSFRGWTPFMWACSEGTVSCVRVLLKDPRVNLNERGSRGSSPLYSACFGGHILVVKWWIASGREMDLGESGNDKTDVIGRTKLGRQQDLAALLERFQEIPEETRHLVRVDIGWYDERAAEVFALVVFVSDGLLEVRQGQAPPSRFFKIARQLPLELQMVLCYRVAGSAKEIIHRGNSEPAFQELAKRY